MARIASAWPNGLHVRRLADGRYLNRGVLVAVECKTFLATSRLVSGVVRVVLLKHAGGKWAAYISTDASLSIEEILETVADRWAIEGYFTARSRAQVLLTAKRAVRLDSLLYRY